MTNTDFLIDDETYAHYQRMNAREISYAINSGHYPYFDALLDNENLEQQQLYLLARMAHGTTRMRAVKLYNRLYLGNLSHAQALDAMSL